jgi:16S rRNA processing protein RimM
MEYICIGKIVNTFGIKGELKIQSYSDFDAQRYKKGNTVYVHKDGKYLPFQIASFRTHKGFSLVAFAQNQDINLVEQYKECEVFIEKSSRAKLPEGEYYRSELEGLSVYTEDHELIGTVKAVEETNGANNYLRIVTADEKEVLVPYVKAFISSVDPEQKQIIIRRVEGLL